MAGCASPRGDVVTVRYQGWDDCWRMSNGTVDLVVVPQVGRIMRYGFIGQDNMLWENPDLPGLVSPGPGTWLNYGGDKVWPWPQDQWKSVTGRDWPPPVGVEEVGHRVERIGPRTLRLTSPELRGYGVRIVRDISLAPTGSRVTMTSRYEAVPDRPIRNWPQVWTVSQIPPPDVAAVRIAGDPKQGALYENINQGVWQLAVSDRPNVRWLNPPPGVKSKVGVRADVIAVAHGKTVFTQRVVGTDPDTLRPPTYQAQLYAEPKPSPGENGRAYWEVEFLGGWTRNRPAVLTVEWDLHPMTANRPRENVEAILAGPKGQ